MISAAQALLIADKVAHEQQWGRVDETFEVVAAEHQGQPAWEVRRRRPRLGFDCWFRINATDGTVLLKEARGVR
jgi:hypothetical protein